MKKFYFILISLPDVNKIITFRPFRNPSFLNFKIQEGRLKIDGLHITDI